MSATEETTQFIVLLLLQESLVRIMEHRKSKSFCSSITKHKLQFLAKLFAAHGECLSF